MEKDAFCVGAALHGAIEARLSTAARAARRPPGRDGKGKKREALSIARPLRKVCRKPGSVLFVVRTGTTLPLSSDNHLSRPAIADRLKRPTRTRPGQGLKPKLLRSLRSCSRWGLPAALSPTPLVVSYTTVPPLPVPARKAPAIGGPFLWHYPSARADWTLSSILPCGARTFLSRPRPPAIVCQTFRYLS